MKEELREKGSNGGTVDNTVHDVTGRSRVRAIYPCQSHIVNTVSESLVAETAETGES
jgi:hypothetical protein